MSLAIRVSREYNEVIDWVEAIECDKILVYQHNADEEISRTHIHMLVINPQKKPDALKTRFTKAYQPEEKGNALWAWKTTTEDYDLYITYMSKGTIQPIYNKGFILNELEQLRLKWVDSGRKEPEAKEAKETKGVITKWEMLQEMKEELGEDPKVKDILRTVKKVLLKHKQVIGQYKVMDYIDMIVMDTKEQKWLQAMEQNIERKYGMMLNY